MCGFAGLYLLAPFEAPAALRARVLAMARTIAHRGPDQESALVLPFAAAAFRRLSIVDLQTGGQPVHSRDGAIAVFFNGEIYNHTELRERLRREHGVDVQGGSDAAVLPHLYERYGERFVELLNGMFAICVLDARDRSCRLYRDRLGIKPLYFAVTERAVVFGSELKPIWRSGLVPAAIDEDQVVPFLELFYVPGARTLARGIDRLLPGEFLRLSPHEPPRRVRYWSLRPRAGRPAGDVLDELDALLADATRLQLMADVPLGLSLSGGIDSGLIAHWVRRSSSNVRAYTIAFPDTDPGELAAARATARALGLEQVEIEALPGDFLDELDRTAACNDEPVADPAFQPALQVATAASRHVKVLLAGTGADELFAGYGHHAFARRARAYRLLAFVLGDRLAARATGFDRADAVRAAARAYGRSRLPWHAQAMTHLSAADRAALRPVAAADHLRELGEAFAAAADAGLDPMNRQLAADAATYLPHQLLALLDRTTMAVSIEGRVPYLDHRVVELALAIPGRGKYRLPHGNKWLLRRLAARHLPPLVTAQQKRGFPSPVRSCLAPARLPAVRERLLDRSSFVADFLPAAWLHSLLADGGAMQRAALTVHSLLVLDTWHRTFVARAHAADPEPRPAAVRT
jgi:asparagine synthase (glutamine-hydrolysing)